MMRVDACSALPISAVEIPSALRESPTTMRRTWTSTDAAFRDNTLPLTLKSFAGSFRSTNSPLAAASTISCIPGWPRTCAFLFSTRTMVIWVIHNQYATPTSFGKAIRRSQSPGTLLHHLPTRHPSPGPQRPGPWAPSAPHLHSPLLPSASQSPDRYVDVSFPLSRWW